MKIIKEFKEFAIKGNVIDLAIGIIIGAAFSKIVSSLVNDIIMPPLGVIISGINFTDIKILLKAATLEGDKVIKEAVYLKIGNFLQVLFDFLITAFAIFIVIKGINKVKVKKESTPEPPKISVEEKLLTEIRDLLKNK
ncbi:MAG TPA: large-conductance mechanosensitive channel protein MscL [Bacteroidales bacterium]|nr:large-conductance mechanosensitive channel protein MscL [Bacteroidales bacterium]